MSGGKKKSLIRIKTFLHKNGLIYLLMFTAFLITTLMVMTGEHIQEAYELSVGGVAPKKFIAPRQVENRIATERKKDEIKNSFEPLFKKEPEVEKKVLLQITRFFEEISKLKSSYGYEENQALEQIKKRSPIFLTDEQFRFNLQIDQEEREQLKENSIRIAERILSAGVKEETLTKSILDVKDEFTRLDLGAELQTLGYHIVSSVIRPNVFEDAEATNQELTKKLATVEPEMILAGEMIVDQNVKITEETYEILKELGLIQQAEKMNYIPYIGALCLILLIHVFFYGYVYAFYQKIIMNKKEMLLLFTIYCIMITIIRLMNGLNFMLIPIPIAAMLIAILMDVKLGIILNLVITSIGSLIYDGNLSFVLFFLISGSIASLLVMQTVQRNKILWVGFFAGLVNSIVILGMDMFLNGTYSQELFINLLYGIFNGGLSIIITIGSLPFWEVAFDIITPIKLLELTNPNQPLIKRLLIEAPGTYHHSLLVANLAEAAASDVGGNPLLARVGAYYHDIGKLTYPHYFKENQMGENPHDYVEPELSAQIIIQHIRDGMKLGKEYHLPKSIRDFIEQHQGTTLVKYFYFQAVQENPDEEISEDQFRYPGPKPQNKENAIVMLADTVEAAVRALQAEKQDAENIENLIRLLIKDKLDDGQLDESTLMIKDLKIITKSFMKVFNGMYHERIEYPQPQSHKEEDEYHDNTDGKQEQHSHFREDDGTAEDGNSDITSA